MNKLQKLVAWVARTPGGVLESQIVGSGMSSTLNKALRAGLVDMTAHATVRDPSGAPAATVIRRIEGKA